MSDYQDDLLADVLRFYPQFGTDPFEVMTGPVFFTLAPRLSVYGGVMACRVQEQHMTCAEQPVPTDASEVSPEVFRAQFLGSFEGVNVNG